MMELAGESEESIDDMVASLHTVHETQQATINSLNLDLAAIQGKLSYLEDEHQKRRERKLNVSKACCLLRDEVEMLGLDKIPQCCEQIEKANSSLITNQTALDRINRKIKSVEDRFNEISNRAKERCIIIEEANSRFVSQDDMNSLTEEVANMEMEKQTLTENILSLDATIKDQESELQAMTTDSTHVRNLIRQLESKLGERQIANDRAHSNHLGALNYKADQLKTSYARMRNQVVEVNSQISSRRGA
eukprot:sb/3468819/